MDQIEIGRSARCQVRYDESFSTVSRRHAAIVKDGENWKLVQLSETNSTFLNGHRVQNEWYLQNGDEIQLSVNGPKLGFIIPTGRKATVGSIGLTRRMSLFRQQALRPYKTAITILACLILLLAAGGGYKLYDLHKENKRLAHAADEQIREINEVTKKNADLAQEIASKGETIELKKMESRIIRQNLNKNVSGYVDNAAINKCLPNIFFVWTLGFEITTPEGEKVTVECGNGEDQLPGWTGTGFLLSDGRFVTARHVVEAWYFFINGGEIDKTRSLLNLIANNGGKVVAHFGAISSSGKKMTFTSEQFHCNRYGDKEKYLEDGHRMVLASLNNTDYAYYNVGGHGLPFNTTKSSNLERGTRLTVLGFPLGLGVNSATDINPIYGSAIVSADGLQQGIILTTDSNYESGNSGGPVFYTNDDGELEVVGIVSASGGRNTGFIVPISAIR